MADSPPNHAPLDSPAPVYAEPEPCPIAPRAVPELRHGLAHWLDDTAPMVWAQIMSISGDSGGGFNHQPLGERLFYTPPKWDHLPVVHRAAVLASAESARVRAADLFHVSEDTTRLALHAGTTLPDFTLRPEDLPARHGFLVWGASIARSDDATTPAGEPIVACSWGLFNPDTDTGPANTVWVSFYAYSAFNDPDALAAAAPEPAQRALLRTLVFELNFERETVLPFTDTPQQWFSQAKDAGGDPSLAYRAQWLEPLVRTLVATWLLMGQDLTDQAEAPADAKSRLARKLAKRGRPLPPVRLVELHRPRTGGGEDSGRRVGVKFVVRGHWRNQWYPSQQRHKPKWIHPYIKGPEDGPWAAGETVTTVHAPPAG